MNRPFSDAHLLLHSLSFVGNCGCSSISLVCAGSATQSPCLAIATTSEGYWGWRSKVYRRLQLYERFPTPGAYFGENSRGHVNIKPSFDTVSGSKLPLRPPPEGECRHSSLASQGKDKYALLPDSSMEGEKRWEGKKHMKARPRPSRDSGGGKCWSRKEERHIACDCVLFFHMKHSDTCFGAGSKGSRTPVFAGWGLI